MAATRFSRFLWPKSTRTKGYTSSGHKLLFFPCQIAPIVEFEQRAGQVKTLRGAKAELVLTAIRQQLGDFRLVDIERACPDVGREWIRSLLADLKAAEEVSCRGKGPAARWRFLGSQGINF